MLASQLEAHASRNLEWRSIFKRKVLCSSRGVAHGNRHRVSWLDVDDIIQVDATTALQRQELLCAIAAGGSGRHWAFAFARHIGMQQSPPPCLEACNRSGVQDVPCHAPRAFLLHPSCTNPVPYLQPAAASLAARPLHQGQWSRKVDAGQEASVCEGAFHSEYQHSRTQHVTAQHLQAVAVDRQYGQWAGKEGTQAGKRWSHNCRYSMVSSCYRLLVYTYQLVHSLHCCSSNLCTSICQCSCAEGPIVLARSVLTAMCTHSMRSLLAQLLLLLCVLPSQPRYQLGQQGCRVTLDHPHNHLPNLSSQPTFAPRAFSSWLPVESAF